MSREYDTDTYRHMNTATRVLLVTVVLLAAAITYGYSLCFGEIQGQILFAIVTVCLIVLAFAIFGERRARRHRPTRYGHQPQLAAVSPVEAQPLQAFPAGTVKGEDSVMNYKGQPFNWVDFDPTAPDPV
jgi:uncharacterized membrane protein YfcA